MSPPRAVAIVTGADTVSAAIGSLQSLRRGLPPWCDIVLAYSTAPACVTERVRAAAGNRHVTILESETWHSQHEARNRAIAALPPRDFYLILDLDSRIEPGSLVRCIDTHTRTGADLVGGVILYGASIDFGREGEKIIHYAGGESRFRPDADGRPGMEEFHAFVARRLDHLREEIGDQPWQCEQLEFHGMCMTRRAVEAVTPFDADLLVFEPSDLALQARKLGLKRVMDPLFEVTYEAAAEYLCDIRPYREQWGSAAVAESVRYFARKYGLPTDGELVAHQSGWNRRHYEDIGAVTRPAFPAPPLIDLCDHPFAQTWPQLLQQLRRQDWSVEEIAGAKRCHDVGRELADGLYRACGKPFVAHLIGTASILAAYGAPPILAEGALVHAAYEQLGIARDDGDLGASALRQRVGLNVDRVLRSFAQQDFSRLLPPETEQDLAFYRVADARVLLMRVANEIEQYLDGAAALVAKRGNAGPLMAHARKVLPVLGFGELLQAFESAVALSDDLAGSVPDILTENRQQSYRILDRTAPDTLALPDGKWIEVATFLRRERREHHVVAAPDEFRYLCNGIRREILMNEPWNGCPSEALVVLHKGRLERHPKAALAAVASATPIFANEVFVLFSRSGKPVGADDQVHLGRIEHAIGNVRL